MFATSQCTFSFSHSFLRRKSWPRSTNNMWMLKWLVSVSRWENWHVCPPATIELDQLLLHIVGFLEITIAVNTHYSAWSVHPICENKELQGKLFPKMKLKHNQPKIFLFNLWRNPIKTTAIFCKHPLQIQSPSKNGFLVVMEPINTLLFRGDFNSKTSSSDVRWLHPYKIISVYVTKTSWLPNFPHWKLRV